MMGPAFSQLDLEVVQARQNELFREYRRSQKSPATPNGVSRLAGAIRAVSSRL